MYLFQEICLPHDLSVGFQRKILMNCNYCFLTHLWNEFDCNYCFLTHLWNEFDMVMKSYLYTPDRSYEIVVDFTLLVLLFDFTNSIG
jgi:hypothetical protein